MDSATGGFASVALRACLQWQVGREGRLRTFWEGMEVDTQSTLGQGQSTQRSVFCHCGHPTSPPAPTCPQTRKHAWIA